MCGIVVMAGPGTRAEECLAMVRRLAHRGPDASGMLVDLGGRVALGHSRLSILDVSDAGTQPMSSLGGTRVVFNGEVYNYLELRAELDDYPYESRTDTEVLIAAYERWGDACLGRLVGMFAFAIWDPRRGRLFAARDRFGVKPLYYYVRSDGTLLLASEIKALHTAGAPQDPDAVAWASYFADALTDHSERTFWRGIRSLAPGHALTWENGEVRVSRWYDLAEAVGPDVDTRPVEEVIEEYSGLLAESVDLRFRSDVPVGVALSGGLDSSLLLALVGARGGRDADVAAFTFTTGDPDYDELPWVRQMLTHTGHPLVDCRLLPEDVPEMAASLQSYEDEPYGGLPTLAYARLFERAREHGVVVLLDGQGMDEQWAGYDYYRAVAGAAAPVVQGAGARPARPGCLVPDFLRLAEGPYFPEPFADGLRNLQYRDARYTKLPRALRFNDRASMRASVELREPFLDHRLFELALRQPADRKLRDGVAKWLPREIARRLAPGRVADAPKRPVQTPQREWLRGPLSEWADACIESALDRFGGVWLDPAAVRAEWEAYRAVGAPSSLHVWQWINLGLTTSSCKEEALHA